MQTIKHPLKSTWETIVKRPEKPVVELNKLVEEIFTEVALNGDSAVQNFTLRFDGKLIEDARVSPEEIKAACRKVPGKLKTAIKLAYGNITAFHASQKDKINKIETSKGVTCWRESRPIEKVGLYIPGGTAPLFSTVLMLGIPARMAGCREIILCSPPGKDGIHPAILYAASLAGITEIYKSGGVQAIAAMTLGTETITKVDKIFGPGNQYVTAAKQFAQQYIPIDMPAGPSEVLVIADKSANPSFVAADLLSQAEHGADSQVIVVSDQQKMLNNILLEVNKQIELIPRREVAIAALQQSRAILFKNLSECIEFSNAYAPEHLILAVKSARKYIRSIQHAGSVFIGNYSCESAGDYASGTNHTLPTNGYARNYSGVSLESFLKKITFQHISKKGLMNIGPAIEIMAEAEELNAHKQAVSIRLKKIKA